MGVSFGYGWFLCNCKIQVHGNLQFRRKIQEYVHELKTTYLGRELFRRLASNEVIHIVPGRDNFAYRKVVKINTYEAENAQLIAWNEKNEKIFVKSKGCIVFAHELIHILHNQRGLFLGAIPSSDPDFTNLEEELTITGHAENQHDPICEYAFADAFHLPRRISHVAFSFFLEGDDPTDSLRITGMTRMHEAAYWGVTPQLKFFLAKGANLEIRDNFRKTPLHEAASHSIESVRLLLENGADINAVDRYGYTPLFFAIINNQIEIVRELLKRSASMEHEDISGNSSWFTAVIHGNLEIINAFLENEVDIHQKNSINGGSSLHYAIHPKVIRLLIDKKMDVHSKDNSGLTPLHIATTKGRLDLIRAFLDYGKAQLNISDNFGNTPDSLAETLGKHEVINLFWTHYYHQMFPVFTEN